MQCNRLYYYLSKEIIITFDDNLNCPTGNLDGITIVFNHYKSITEALDAWNKRKQRVNYDNLFYIFDDIDDIEYNDLLIFNTIPSKGKVIFTAKEYECIENTVIISEYVSSGKLEHYLMHKNKYTGKYPSDENFDFVRWLNNEG